MVKRILTGKIKIDLDKESVFVEYKGREYELEVLYISASGKYFMYNYQDEFDWDAYHGIFDNQEVKFRRHKSFAVLVEGK